MNTKKKFLSVILLNILFLILFIKPIYGYTDFIKDETQTWSTLTENFYNEAANELSSNNIYLYFTAMPLNTNSSTYDTMRMEYFEKYNTLKQTDKVGIIYYFQDDPLYDNGRLYYYDDTTDMISEEKIQELNLLLEKYNKKNEFDEAYSLIYSQIINDIAKNNQITLTNCPVVQPKYGTINFYIFPTLICISIVITAIFAFRKRF